MIKIKHSGGFNNIENLLTKNTTIKYTNILNKYGRQGVLALSSATPVDSKKTADSWDFKITKYKGGTTITWTNSNVTDGVPVAILIQYGHGTRNGGYVQGRDYINPALKPIFDKMAQDVWKEVTRA